MKSYPFSKRTQWRVDANPLTEKFRSLEDSNTPVLNLTVSNPTLSQFEYLSYDLLSALGNTKNLTYNPSPHGLVEAREAVCRYYGTKGVSLSPYQVFLTANTSEAYSFVFRLLANEKDRILSPTPSYPLLEYLAQWNDIELERYPLLQKNSWKVDLEELRRKLERNPKALLLVHPNNPTGSFIHQIERNEIINMIREKQTALIVDEVFHDYALSRSSEFSGSFAGNENNLTFTLSGISKILGLPQMKLSWIVVSGPDQLIHQAVERLEVISDIYLSMSTPIQNALPAWFEKQESVQKEVLHRLTANVNTLNVELKSQKNIKFTAPDGGWAALLELPFVKSDEEWALLFLEKKNVLLHPGYLFDFSEGSFLVASLLTPPDIFQEGIQRIVTRDV